MKRSNVVMASLALVVAVTPAASADPDSHLQMRHSAVMDQVRNSSEQAEQQVEQGAAAVAAADVTATVTDPTGDTDPVLEPKSDITAGSLSFGEGGPNVTVTVPGGTDPATDPNWDLFTFAEWDIDTNNDAAPEYIIQAFRDSGSFVAGVFTVEGDFVCEGAADFLSPIYTVSFDPTCVGNPGAARFLTAFVYDDGTTVSFDFAPNVGLSAPARNDFATAKPAARLGGTWYLRNTLTAGFADFTFSYGRGTDFALMCDWDGDGLKTPGVVRDNLWFLRNSNSAGPSNANFGYGLATDFPVCGDWNGDGVDTVGVVRGNTWLLRNSNTGGAANINFGYGPSGSLPLVWR